MFPIVVENLCKTFSIPERSTGLWGAVRGLFSRKNRILKALDDISFSVKEGDLLGFIGPNGAGKSTTIKILSGILVPDSGRVSVFGKTPWEHRVETVRQIGVVFGQRTQLWWDLPVIESFDLIRDIYKIPKETYRRNCDKMIAHLNLSAFLHTPVRQLSLGQRMRCELTASLLHDPKLLFLDEPTIGLDAVSKLAMRDFIRTLNQEKKTTIILTTHDMDDIEALCKRIVVISEGSLFLDGTLAELRSKVSRERFLIVDLENERDCISHQEARVVRQEGHRVWLRFDPEQLSAAQLISQITARHAILDLFVKDPSIEEVVAQLYKEPSL